MLSFFPLDVLDEILDLIESVSEGFLTYSSIWFRMLIPSSGTGTRDCDIWSKLATRKNSKILIC